MEKKTFKKDINPAMRFLSQESIEKGSTAEKQPAQPPEKTPTGYKRNPLYVETKSKRLQLLIQPSLYEKLKTRATEENTSVNGIVNTILLDAFTEE
jgi:hypothetical protein